MAKAWIENGVIFIGTDEIAPLTAIDVPDDTLPQDLVVDKNGNVVLKSTEQKLQEKKQELLQKLSNEAKAYIEKYYPELKQRSDVIDKENGESYLALQMFDTIQLRKDITELVMQHYPDFTIALQLLLGKYTSDNQYVNYWLEQLLKVAFRIYFVFCVKQEHNFIKQAIENAKSIEELPRIEFNTSYPEV